MTIQSVIGNITSCPLTPEMKTHIDIAYTYLGESTTKYATLYMIQYATKKANGKVDKSEWTAVFPTCATCAHKFVTDRSYLMSDYSKMFSIDIYDLLDREINLLILCEFNMFIHPNILYEVFPDTCLEFTEVPCSLPIDIPQHVRSDTSYREIYPLSISSESCIETTSFPHDRSPQALDQAYGEVHHAHLDLV
jgi:hypothetical protein